MSLRKLDAVRWEMVVMMYCCTKVSTALTEYRHTSSRHMETMPSRSMTPARPSSMRSVISLIRLGPASVSTVPTQAITRAAMNGAL